MENFSNPEKQEREPIELLIESSLAHGVKFDEGQNAIVLEVNPEDLSEEERTVLFEQLEGESDKSFVSKVLRIFNAGHSEEEAASQIKAKDIVDEQDPEIQAGLAKVPEIYFHRDITISDEALKDRLTQEGIDVSDGKLGVLLMYRVEGVDFLNYLLQEAIKRADDEDIKGRPSLEFAKDQLAKGRHEMSTEELFKVASNLVGLNRTDKVQLDRNNREKLLNWLQKKGFVMDKQILDKIENTIELLNQNDFYHRDLTERNAMLEFDEEGEIKEVYVIDFEKAGQEESEEFGEDMAILRNYKGLAKTSDERVAEVVDKDMEAIERLRLRVAKAKGSEYSAVEKELMAVLKSKGKEDRRLKESQAWQLAEDIVGDQAHELLAAILLDVSEGNKSLARDYIEHRLADSDVPTRYFNLLSRVKQKI